MTRRDEPSRKSISNVSLRRGGSGNELLLKRKLT